MKLFINQIIQGDCLEVLSKIKGDFVIVTDPPFNIGYHYSKNLDKKIIGILGMAFKPGCDDIRDSLSYRMKNILENEVKEVLCSDSYVKSRQFVSAEELLKKSDIIILMTPHDQYKELKIKKPFVDIWNFWGKGTGL